MRKIGSIFPTVGALFGIFCPACIPALAVFLPTVGLGFLANLIVSRVILLVLLGGALLALHISAMVHRRQLPFLLGLVGVMGMIAGRNIVLQPWLMNGSGALLIAAAVLDFWYRRTVPGATCVPAS